jgi:hypothetical protein
MRRGDFVQVRNPEEILNTLDEDGSLNNLPFMPEMVQFCGRRFRVDRSALTVCMSGAGGGYRGFERNDVVTLEGVRCSGSAHGGCQKACMIFWHRSWLEKVKDTPEERQDSTASALERLRNHLKTETSSNKYFCQASELPRATIAFRSRSARIRQWLRGLLVGNFTIVELARGFSLHAFLYVRRRVLGLYPRGTSSRTSGTLGLTTGDWVQVKPLNSIVPTLDEFGRNRGLQFTADMRLWCGRKLRVRNRLDKIIADGTGTMRLLRDTVCLDGVTCGCSYMGLGMAGCSRCELTYWREAWLEPCQPPDSTSKAAQANQR